MTDVIVVDRRFCGPPDSANGGYVCGLVAARVDGPAEVTLRNPPPLDTPMPVQRRVDGRAEVRLDGELVAEARPVGAVGIDAPAPVALADALAGTERSWITRGESPHPFPTCFTCGPAREAGDGQRVFVGPVTGRDVAAAPWTPDDSLPVLDGRVAPEIVWAVLDCSGGIGSGYVDGEFDPAAPHVLGRFTADVRASPAVGERCVAVGWRIGLDGRKLFAGSAVFGEHDRLLGLARATWIELT